MHAKILSTNLSALMSAEQVEKNDYITVVTLRDFLLCNSPNLEKLRAYATNPSKNIQLNYPQIDYREYYGILILLRKSFCTNF